MGYLNKNTLRKQHRPDPPIKFLMIGESPPKGENFFYLCKGPIYEHTRSVFKRVFNDEVVTKGDSFLKWFESKGCYLEDLCEQSTNGLKWGSPKRTYMWQDGIPRLSAEIGYLKPKAAFVFVKGIIEYVTVAISACNDDGVARSLMGMMRCGPMPGKGDPVGEKFEKALESCLLELCSKKVL